MSVLIDDITPVAVVRTGTTMAAKTVLTGSSAGSGVKFPNDGRTWLEIVNNEDISTGVDVVVTVHAVETVNGNAVADLTFTIAKGGILKRIGPFPAALYNIQGGADSGKVKITFDDPTPGNVACTAYRI